MNYVILVIVFLFTSVLAQGRPLANDIVFYSSAPGARNQIYSVRADGSGQKNLSNDPANWYSDPSWSPGGTKVLHGRGGGIWVMDADGTNPDQLISFGQGGLSNPVSSPDGKNIAFVWDGHGFEPPSIWVRDLVSGGTRLLTWITPGAESEFRLSKIDWSPDSTKIVFARYSSGIWYSNICVINADGTGEVALTHDVGRVYNLDPSWSPDGSKIAFARDADVYVEPSAICTVNADGTNRVCITYDLARDDYYPSWSPDGRRIAFSGYSHVTGMHQIYVVDAIGTNLVQVTHNPFSSIAPDWRRSIDAVPDGMGTSWDE